MKKKPALVTYDPMQAMPQYDFIHPWMPRQLQKFRERVANVLSINYYDTERLFTEPPRQEQP